MAGKKRPIGISILSIVGCIIGIFSFFLGLIGAGPFPIVFGGIWIILGPRLWKLQNKARIVALVTSVLYLLIYLFVFYAALTVDRFFYIGLLMQSPLALTSVMALIILPLSKIKNAFLRP